MSIHDLQGANALVLFKVGPIMVCSPALPVESVVLPPHFTVPPGTSRAEPGMFKSMYGLVRVVDLRVRFGVDKADQKSPGRIIIAEVTGGYAGFWVDEIEDVISFPEKGWAPLPALVPKEVFNRALIRKEGIRLYADLEKLDKFKSTGYLRSHIETLKEKKLKPIESAINNKVDNNKTNNFVPAKKAEADLESKVHKNTQENKLVESSKPSPQASLNKVTNTSTINHADKSSYESKKVDFNKLKPKEKSGALISKSVEINAVNKSLKANDKIEEKLSNKKALSHRTDSTVNQVVTHKDYDKNKHKLAQGSAFKVDIKEEKNRATTDNSQSYLEQANKVANVSSHIAEKNEGSGAAIFWLSGFLVIFVATAVVGINYLDEDVSVTKTKPVVMETYLAEVEEDEVMPNVKGSGVHDVEIAKEIEADRLNVDQVEISNTDEGVVIVINDYQAEVEDFSSSASDYSLAVESNSNAVQIKEMKKDGSNAHIDEAIKEDNMRNELVDSSQLASKLNVGLVKLEGDKEIVLSDEMLIEPIENITPDIEPLFQVSSDADKKSKTSLLTNEDIKPEVNIKAAAQVKTSEIAHKKAEIKRPIVKPVTLNSTRHVHVVIKGDTLWDIAKRYVNNPWKYPELARLSEIKNPDLIYPGQKVIIIQNYKK